MSIDKGMDKEDVVYGTLLSHKKDEIMPFAATWSDKSDKDKYHIIH